MKITPEKTRELKTRLRNSALIRRGFRRPRAYENCDPSTMKQITKALWLGTTADIQRIRTLLRDTSLEGQIPREPLAAYARHQRAKRMTSF